MKIIKFRGKSKTSGEWVYGYYVKVFAQFPRGRKHLQHYILNIHGNGGMLFVGNRTLCLPHTIGQFTGLVDKYDKEIYEGDLLKTKNGRICEIYWLSSSCYQGWDLAPVKPTKEYSQNWDANTEPDEYDLWDSNNLEIVGTIYD